MTIGANQCNGKLKVCMCPITRSHGRIVFACFLNKFCANVVLLFRLQVDLEVSECVFFRVFIKVLLAIQACQDSNNGEKELFGAYIPTSITF